MEEERKASWIFVFTGIWITLVVIAFARLSYGVVLPYMKEGLSISYQQAGLLGTMTSLGYLLTVIFAGQLSAKWGEKQSIMLGISLVTVGFASLSFTSSFAFSLLFMSLLGIGTAFSFTPLVALLTGWFPDRRGLVIGYINGGAGVGMLFSGFIVPFLHHLYPAVGWKMAWGMFALISVLVLFLALVSLKNAPKATHHQQDHGVSLTPAQIYTDPKIILIGLIYGIVGITFIVQVTFMMSYMLESGVSSRWAGYLIAANGVLSVFSAPVLGGISDRLGRKNALVLAMGFNFFATLIPVLVPNVIGFGMNHIVIGMIATGVFTLVQVLSTELVHPRQIPIAFGYVTFYFAFGQLLGPTAAGWLIDQVGFHGAFLFNALCLGLGLFLTTRIKIEKKVVVHTSVVS